MLDKVHVCTRCIMDAGVSDITFDAVGQCNYCDDFLVRKMRHQQHDQQQNLAVLIQQIKDAGANKPYDCIVGVSGGVDSSYVLYLAKQYGLRPLAVHMDNGWNSELAQNNIAQLVQKLEVDLYTHVIDWQEYKALMQAFLDADVIDLELLYDNAALAVNYKLAQRYGIRYILSGCNMATEGISIPARWNWFKLDKKNIYALAKRRQVRIRTFPSIGLVGYLYARFLKRIKWVSLLDYIDYNKVECVKFLQEHYGFKPYPYKHYESIFTRFYQGYLLPKKFGVDKRKVHLSTLVMSGQLTREQALNLMQQSPYPTEAMLLEDRHYFLKKMQWSQTQLEEYLKRPEKAHDIYGSIQALLQKYKFFKVLLLKLKAKLRWR